LNLCRLKRYVTGQEGTFLHFIEQSSGTKKMDVWEREHQPPILTSFVL